MRKLLSKEDFCKYIERIIEVGENSAILEKALQVFADDIKFTGFYFDNSFDIEFLENLLDDDNHWISWWLFEGREDPESNYLICNKEKFVIKTPEDLYDFLFQDESEDLDEYYIGGKCSINVINDLIERIENDSNEKFKHPEEYISLLKLTKKNIMNELHKKSGMYFIENVGESK